MAGNCYRDLKNQLSERKFVSSLVVDVQCLGLRVVNLVKMQFSRKTGL